MSPRVEARLRRTFASVRSSRNFRLYLTGQLISATGTWINATAASWLVLQLTGSGVALGVNMALLFLPMLLLGPYGGVLADRFDKRRILIWTQASFVVTSATLFALVLSGVIELWMVYGLSLVAGVITSIDNPTRQSFYAELVGTEQVTNAVSLNSAAFTGARILGPAIAGALIAWVDISVCFALDAVSYTAVLIALIAMRPSELFEHPRTTRQSGHLVAGIRYVWRSDELRRPLLVMAAVFTLAFNFQVLLPLLAERTFNGDARTFGLLSSFAGLGSFVGAMALAGRDGIPTFHRLAGWSLAAGGALVLAGLAPTLPLAAAAMVPLGITFMGFLITGNTTLQLNARPEARGRVMALYGAVFLGSTPLGSPIAGWVGQHLGAREGLVLSGIVALTVGLIAMRLRARATVQTTADESESAEPALAPPATA